MSWITREIANREWELQRLKADRVDYEAVEADIEFYVAKEWPARTEIDYTLLADERILIAVVAVPVNSQHEEDYLYEQVSFTANYVRAVVDISLKVPFVTAISSQQTDQADRPPSGPEALLSPANLSINPESSEAPSE